MAALACQPLQRLHHSMSYTDGYPVRPIAGRLALNFLNTADWSEKGEVVHERLVSLEDVGYWQTAVGLKSSRLPKKITEAHDLRARLRRVFLPGNHGRIKLGELQKYLRQLKLTTDCTASELAAQPLLSLIANSALAILVDPNELSRLKLCPGCECGWMFIDETKNARRRWCMMETCGNRAKASRHYARAGPRSQR